MQFRSGVQCIARSQRVAMGARRASRCKGAASCWRRAVMPMRQGASRQCGASYCIPALCSELAFGRSSESQTLRVQ
eukprot:9374090-Lingulodinium_polyedra.AAC.1